MPPALLARARNIAAEHQKLSDKLAGGFDTLAAKKVGEYGPVVDALKQWDRANEVRRPTTRAMSKKQDEMRGKM